jgi:hypothetical protein
MTDNITPRHTHPFPRRLIRLVKLELKNMLYLFATSAPLLVYACFFKTILSRRNIKKHYARREEFLKILETGSYSNDWFSENIPYWLMVFSNYNLFYKNIKALEIGSWEGLSSFFLLQTLPYAKITCVDTWEGADEHKGQDVLNRIENTFDANLSVYKDRLTKFKGTSFSFFNSQNKRAQFDLIYIDGSHHCDDVIVDAVKGFEQLNVGGIMIFDDYFWRHYKRKIDNPAGAINSFLKLKRGCYEIIAVYHQLIIRKTIDRY